MWANRVIRTINRLLSPIFKVVELPTTLITFVIAHIPLLGIAFTLLVSLAWQAFLWPLVFGAWCWRRAPRGVQPLLAAIFIPVAILGNMFVWIIGPLSREASDIQSHLDKQNLCQLWPIVFMRTSDGRDVVQAYQDETGKGFITGILHLCSLKSRQMLSLD